MTDDLFDGTERLFAGTRGGIWRARTCLAVQWMKYVAHLATFFVVPWVYVFAPRLGLYWKGTLLLLLWVVGEMLVEAWRAYKNPDLTPEQLHEGNFIVFLSLVTVLMMTLGFHEGDPSVIGVGAIFGAIFWVIIQYMTLQPPPRLEEVKQ